MKDKSAVVIKEDWRDITPSALVRAVEHIRASFKESFYNINHSTSFTCNFMLHREDRPSSPTEPVIFQSHFSNFLLLLDRAVKERFSSFFRISIANNDSHCREPIEWAELQVKSLFRTVPSSADFWVIYACDKESPTIETIKSWRAPLFMHMINGNRPYEPDKVWVRGDESFTQRVLEGWTDLYKLTLDAALTEASGVAAVKQAQSAPIVSNPDATSGDREQKDRPVDVVFKSELRSAMSDALKILGIDADYKSVASWIAENRSFIQHSGVYEAAIKDTGERDMLILLRKDGNLRKQFQRDLAKVKKVLRPQPK